MKYAFAPEKMSLHRNDQPPAYTEATQSTPSHASTYSTASRMPDSKSTPPKTLISKLAMLTLCTTDKMRLIRFPEPITALASEIIQTHWPKGIQRVQDYDESTEFKLKGNPLSYCTDEEKVAIRVTLMRLLDAFAKQGWVVRSSGGRVGRMGDYNSYGQRDSLIFEHQEPRVHSWLCISFDSSDLLHLINAPTELAEAMIAFFGERVEKCNKDFKSGDFEIKFKGTPWSRSSGKGSVQTRILILDLMQCLEEQGYSMCTALDIDDGSGGNTFQSNGELWFWYR